MFAAENQKPVNHTPLINVLIKAIRLLKCFTMQNPRHTIQSLSKELNMPKSTVHRILTTLHEQGFVSLDKQTSSYQLGMAIVQLSSIVLANLDFRRVIYPLLYKLATSVEMNIYLSVLNGADIIYIDEICLNQPVTVQRRLGKTAPAYCTAMGRLMLSDLSKADLDMILGKTALVKYTNNTVTDKENLIEIIKQIKQQGYAVDHEEISEDIWGIAGPIYDYSRRIIASFAVSIPKIYVTDEIMQSTLQKVIKTSEEASMYLGYTK